MRRVVTLRNVQGDLVRGIERTGRSDMPSLIAVNGACWYVEVWRERGWEIWEAGDWEW